MKLSRHGSERRCHPRRQVPTHPDRTRRGVCARRLLCGRDARLFAIIFGRAAPCACLSTRVAPEAAGAAVRSCADGRARPQRRCKARAARRAARGAGADARHRVLTLVGGAAAAHTHSLGCTADLVAGPGCYCAGAEIFASVLGVVRVSPAPEGQEAAKLVEVVRATQGPEGAQSAPVLPQIGSIVIAKVCARRRRRRRRTRAYCRRAAVPRPLPLHSVARSRWLCVRR